MLRKMKKRKHEHDEVPHTSPALPSAQVQQPQLQPTVSNNRCFLHYLPDLRQPKEITYNPCQLKPKVEANDFDSPSAKSIGKFFSKPAPEPTYEAVLQEQLRETENRAKELKQEWQTSGCTVIVDSWKSKCGKSFVSVLVHCSKGMHFLRSIDVSEITEDFDELKSMLSRVVDDVGAHNIVQIVMNDVSPHMQMARQYVLNKYDSFFFTLCVDHCINLLLEKIAALEHVSEVLMKAREITRFLNVHALPMKLKGRYVQEEILSSSYLKFVAVFITLERIWDGYLHSPLHAAGQMLNPRIFYAAGSHLYTVISSGIAACIIQLGKAHYDPRNALAQLEVYEKKLRYFDTDRAKQQIMELPQVKWWSKHGARVPDLQTLARRVLRQTCFGATRYNIDWSLSEKLHAEWDEMTLSEQERFRQKEYVHYNSVLARASPLLHGSSVKQHDRVTLVLQDWIRPQKQAAGRH
uniref:DUF659 domain-containing protein n=1 Tax=Triticum urartu TaxID=4572 RepID=A0A8R7V6J5_TRIUA